MLSISPIIISLILVNGLFSLKGFNDPIFFDRFKFSISSINRGERYRLISSAFLHVDGSHLFFNMFTLYLFGGQALAGLGTFNFLILYFICLLAGNLFALYYHKNNLLYTAVGASGAIMGVLYATILMNPDMKLFLIILPIPIPGFVFAILYLVYTLFGMKKQHDNVGHTAHFGGAVGGILTTLIFVPSVITEAYETLMLLFIITTVAGFIIFKKR